MKLIIAIVCFVFSLNAFSKQSVVATEEVTEVVVFDVAENLHNFSLEDNHKPNPVFTLFKKKQRLNKKITAATLAFPFPFGIVGLHRIYLGTKPYVPVAYIGTVGGVFGILPLIDFCKITFDKDFEQYRDNGKVFMWIKE